MTFNRRLTTEQYRGMMAKKGARPKYGNKKKMVNGIEFESTREARRYQDLALMQQAGHISDLRRQVPFDIRVNKIYIGKWIADFIYTCKDGTERVEDCKGYRTDVYKLKKRLVEALFNIRILES